MKLIESFDDFKQITRNFRNQGKKLSNFFPNPSLNKKWLENKCLYLVKSEDTSFLLRIKPDADEIYYFAVSPESLKKGIARLDNLLKKTAIVETIRKEETPEILSGDKVLLRMSRTGVPHSSLMGQCSREKLSEAELQKICRIFRDNFSPVWERIPDIEELRELNDSNSIKVSYNGADIIGLMIYNLSGKSIHLRYWWVDSRMRGKGIGGHLLRSFFEAGKDTLRQYLWVEEKNETAIMKYKHYGFEFDGLRDDIKILTK